MSELNMTTLQTDFNVKSEIIKNRNEIESLQTQISELKSLVESSTDASVKQTERVQIDSLKTHIPLGVEITDYLTLAARHKRRGNILKSSRVVMLFIFVVVYSSYQYSLYINPEINRLSQSGITRIDHMEMPYFYIKSYGKTSNFDIDSIFIFDHNNFSYEGYDVFGLDYNISDFVYDEKTTEWTMVELCSVIYPCANFLGQPVKSAFLIPPYGAILPIEQTLGITIVAYNATTRNPFNQTINNDTDDAFSWEIGSIKEIENVNLIEFENHFFYGNNLKYTFAESRSSYVIDLFEETNAISDPPTKELHYSATHSVSLYDDDYWGLYPNATSVTEISIYQNPAAGGTKTTLAVTKRTNFTDLLANIGGIISPIWGISFVLWLWLMFGIHIGRFHINGLAYLSPITYAQRQQIKLYLIQLGILNPDT
eukprot:297920_1